MLVDSLRTILVLLHPYCPFVTEELWSQLKKEGDPMLLKMDWPKVQGPEKKYPEEEHGFQILIDTISAVRKLRSEQQIEPKKDISIIIRTRKWSALMESQEAHIRRIAKVKSLTIDGSDALLDNVSSVFLKDIEVHLSLEGLIDKDAEKIKLSSEKEKLEGFIAGIEKKLSNEQFVNNAKEESSKYGA